MATQMESVEIRRHTLNTPWTYSLLDAYQRDVARQIQNTSAAGTLILSEVAPVITRGPRTPDRDILSKGIEIYSTDRGGLSTYHGPGQWILFPVSRIERLTGDSRGVRKAVEILLEIALRVGKIYDSTAHIRQGCELGVWNEKGKFASVGIHVQRGVILHGLAINGFKTPLSFTGLRPCGLDAPASFLLQEATELSFLNLGRCLLHQAERLGWISASHCSL